MSSSDDLIKVGTLIRKAYVKAPDWNSWTFAMFDIWSQRKIGDVKVHGITAWQDDVQIWETDQGEIVGAAAFRDPDYAKIALDPEMSELQAEMLDWIQERWVEKADVDDACKQKELTFETSGSNLDLENLLAARGFQKEDGYYIYREKLLDAHPISPVVLPPGFCIKHIETLDELKKFHQGVNAVFKFIDNVDVYQVLRQARSFHPELDLIILSENGEVAALASVWFDEGLSLAEFEPVATVPDFRKLGMGTAIIQEACNRLKDMGCKTLSVQSWSESVPANRLYEGAGLQPKGVKNYWKLPKSI